jgi:hypothetical protein
MIDPALARSTRYAALLAVTAIALVSLPLPARADDEPPASAPPSATPPPEEPSGHGTEFFYLSADAGFSYIDMASFSSSSFGIQKTSSEGPMFGVGAGLRLAILSLGVRANLNELSDFNLWQLDAELGLHIPSRHWDVYLGIHGGYAFVGTLDSSSLSQVASQSAGAVSIYGGDAGIQLGADYYFNHFLSLGFELAGSALFLHRPPVALPADFSSLPPAQQSVVTGNPLYASSGDSVGLGAAGSLHFGVHF